jgi:hypothetical protein
VLPTQSTPLKLFRFSLGVSSSEPWVAEAIAQEIPSQVRNRFWEEEEEFAPVPLDQYPTAQQRPGLGQDTALRALSPVP